MTTFDPRKDAFEGKFAHDEALRFRTIARRNKLLGLWAAERLELSGADADAYAGEVVATDLLASGDEDVFGKLRRDFDSKGVEQSDRQIRSAMEDLMSEARRQILSEA